MANGKQYVNHSGHELKQNQKGDNFIFIFDLALWGCKQTSLS